MYYKCKFNDDQQCAFCGKDKSGILYCGVQTTKAGKQSNKIERMKECPKEKKRPQWPSREEKAKTGIITKK